MNPLSRSCSKLRRSIIGRLGASSTTVPVNLLVMAGLAALVTLSSAACGSPPSKTPPERTRPIQTPTHTSTPTATPTQIPTLLSPVTLEEPEDDSCLECRSDVTLRWHCPYALQEDESYQLEVEGPDSSLVYRERNDYTLNALSTGQYNWAVTVVRSQGLGQYVAVSEESDTYRFEIAPPAPVVHTISPTSTVQGISVPIVISGENFTHSLLITIGVSLKTTFVNSSTLTTTVPITLETGEYPVLVGSSTGESVSIVSFTVKRQPPPPTPGVLPTPKPPSYPAPELLGIDVFGCSVTFKWKWDGTLAEDEWFAVRLGRGDEAPHSRSWVKERTHPYSMGDEAGEYSWEIAICRGAPSAGACPDLLAVSEREVFTYPGCWKEN